MIDTNQVIQAGQVVDQVKTTISPWLPAISIAAVWLGREIGNVFNWLGLEVELVIKHGGLFKLLGKLLWNKGESTEPPEGETPNK